MPDSMIGSEKNSTLVRREPSVISMVRCACDLNISVSCTSKPKKKKHTQPIIAQIRQKLREVWIIVKNTKKRKRPAQGGMANKKRFSPEMGGRIAQTVDKKLFSPRRGRIALSANERIAEFLDFAIQNKFAHVNMLRRL